MRFRTTPLLAGRTATGSVPEEIAGDPRSTSLSASTASTEHRAAAGVTAGDELELDTEPRAVDDLAEALAPDTRCAVDAWLLPVADAKTDATRRRRIAKTAEALGGEA